MKIKLTLKLVLPLLLFCFSTTKIFAQQRVKEVVLQAFWWDYWNNNFRFKWADYLTELAPRLKAMGVDAIWIPPNYKTMDRAVWAICHLTITIWAINTKKEKLPVIP